LAWCAQCSLNTTCLQSAVECSVSVCVCVLSRWVRTTLGERPNLPAPKVSSHWVLDCVDRLKVPLSVQPRQAATAHVSRSLNRAHTHRVPQVSSDAQSVTLKASAGLKPGMTYTWGARVYLSTAPDTPTDFCMAIIGKTSLRRLAFLSVTQRSVIRFISTHASIVSLAATVCHHHPDFSARL
jgi:hypothetical protein